MYLERANASTICRSILESLSDTLVSLDPSNIRGQAYSGAAVMSSSRAGLCYEEIKTFAMSTMNEESLSDLAVIAMSYSERVIIDEICHAFLQKHTRKLFAPSLFAE